MSYRRIHILLLVLFSLLSMAQTCKRVPKNPPEEIPLSFSQFDYNGLRFIQENEDRDVVTVKVFFKGGLSLVPPGQEGIEVLATDWVVQGGTRSRRAGEFASALASCGGAITTEVSLDYSAFTLRCLREKFKEAFGLFAELITQPDFDPAVFEAVKQGALNRLRRQARDPQAKNSLLARGRYFSGTPYGMSPQGNEVSLLSLNASEVSRYYREALLNKSRMLIVAAGLSDPEKLVQEVIYTLDAIPAGDSVSIADAVRLNETYSVIELRHAGGETPFLRAMIPAPAISEAEAPAMQVAMHLVHGKVSGTLSRQFQLDPAPVSGYAEGRGAYALMMGETRWPSDWARIVVDELSLRRREGFSENEVREACRLLLTDLALEMEDGERACTRLGLADIAGDWKAPLLMQQRIEKLSASEVNEVYRKYCTLVAWTCTGDTTGLNRKAFLQPLE